MEVKTCHSLAILEPLPLQSNCRPQGRHLHSCVIQHSITQRRIVPSSFQLQAGQRGADRSGAIGVVGRCQERVACSMLHLHQDETLMTTRSFQQGCQVWWDQGIMTGLSSGTSVPFGVQQALLQAVPVPESWGRHIPGSSAPAPSSSPSGFCASRCSAEKAHASSDSDYHPS